MTTASLETYRILIRELDERLRVAAHGTRLALDDLDHGSHCRAVGALLPVESDIEAVASLLATILLLHRSHRVGQGGAQ